MAINIIKAAEKRHNALANTTAESARVHISLGNSKLGAIPNFSVLPIVTCKNCAECSKHCYACKGCFNYSNVINAEAENTRLVMDDIDRVENEINAFLNGLNLYRFFRWNTSGDVFTLEYLEMIVRVANANPLTKFLVFTKNFDLFNSYLDENDLPENLSVIFSKWHNANIDNRHGLPVAIVKLNDETEIPEHAFKCTGDCANCLECWNASNGSARYFDLH